MATPQAAFGLYISGALVLTTGIQLHEIPSERPVSALERARARGQVADGVPRLDPSDPMANAAVLMQALAAVPPAGHLGDGGARCDAAPRRIPLEVGGRRSEVRFGARAVCQLERLKRISVAQPGFGRHGLGEVAAFVLGRRLGDGPEVDVTRVVVPPFRFSRDTLTFLPANLGPLESGEAFIATYHTHPEGDIEEGMLSDVDLRFMRRGRVDFAGGVGPLQGRHPGLDWLVDVVETRDGGWNVFAHDEPRLFGLLDECEMGERCPLDDLRTVGSRYYLLTRAYDEAGDENGGG
jgi:hypothetical protein